MLKNKRIYYKYKGIAAFVAMTLSLFAVSCSNDEPLYPGEAGGITFNAPAQIVGGSSRVSYIQNKGFIKVTWEEGDVVQLFPENSTNPIATFVVTDVQKDKNVATFKCTDASGIKDASYVSGIMKYQPVPVGTKVDIDPYGQKENGSLENTQNSSGTEHLKYANVIQAELKNKDLTQKTTLTFSNTTAIFRIIINLPRSIKSGATLTLYGASNWNTGISQVLNFDLNKVEGTDTKLIAYIAAPADGNTDGSFSVALNDGETNTVTRYLGPSRTTYDIGKEYTADFTNTKGQDEEIYDKGGFVDMGLSVLWGTMNLGAESITGDKSFGDYYAWGSTTAATGGFTHNGQYSGVAYDKDLKALANAGIIVSADNPTLTPGHDAATKANKEWFTPTKKQWDELLDNCTWIWNSALKGYEVMSNKNNAVIFMPAAGFYDANNLNNRGNYTYYWTSTANEGTQNSWGMHISGPHKSIAEQSYPRYQGYNIRPVKNKTEGGQSTTDETKTDQTTGK